ncbi:hypothetical protein N9077_01255 [bacterium]|nr:hypothetical protein [bacterium]
MDNIARNYIDHVERDLLEAKHHLQSGLETALERVGSMAKTAKTAMTTDAIAKLRAIEDISEKSIDAIEKHLGRLNFVASQGDIKSYDDFDELAQPLAEALHDARATLATVDEIGTRELGSAAGTIGEAWRTLHFALDSARLELALAKFDSIDEAESLRRNLTKRFEEALVISKAKDAETLGNKLLGIFSYLTSKLGGQFKILFGFSR